MTSFRLRRQSPDALQSLQRDEIITEGRRGNYWIGVLRVARPFAKITLFRCHENLPMTSLRGESADSFPYLETWHWFQKDGSWMTLLTGKHFIHEFRTLDINFSESEDPLALSSMDSANFATLSSTTLLFLSLIPLLIVRWVVLDWLYW